MKRDESILELVDVSFDNDAGVRIFDGLNLSLAPGETAVVIGPTGAGKTSLVELIIGHRFIRSGSVFLFGKKLNPRNELLLSSFRRKIGGVGSVFKLIPDQTVFQNLVLPLTIRGESKSFQKMKTERVLTEFNLQTMRNDPAYSLSRGQKTMVILARAIIADQPLLLIDEPLSGLDEKITAEVDERLKKLAVSGHSMIILTTGQTGLTIPGVSEYYLKSGKLQ
jgi:ABC-type multidrug transport system ATPase subunit